MFLFQMSLIPLIHPSCWAQGTLNFKPFHYPWSPKTNPSWHMSLKFSIQAINKKKKISCFHSSSFQTQGQMWWMVASRWWGPSSSGLGSSTSHWTRSAPGFGRQETGWVFATGHPGKETLKLTQALKRGLWEERHSHSSSIIKGVLLEGSQFSSLGGQETCWD